MTKANPNTPRTALVIVNADTIDIPEEKPACLSEIQEIINARVTDRVFEFYNRTTSLDHSGARLDGPDWAVKRLLMPVEEERYVLAGGSLDGSLLTTLGMLFESSRASSKFISVHMSAPSCYVAVERYNSGESWIAQSKADVRMPVWNLYKTAVSRFGPGYRAEVVSASTPRDKTGPFLRIYKSNRELIRALS